MNQKILNVMAVALETDVALLSENSTSENVANWDSLRHMNLIVALEEEFSIEFDEEEFIELMSFANIRERINSKL